MLNCHKATELMSASQERPLTVRERLRLKLHRAICSGCRQFSRQLGFVRKAAREYGKGEDQRRGSV